MEVYNSDFNGMEGNQPPFVTRRPYLLLFNLSDEEEMKIVRLKRLVRQRYGMVPKVDSRPHITIFLMIAHPNLVIQVEEIVRGFSEEIRAQTVRLTAIRVFPSNRTAYVDVKEQEYLRTLSQRIAEKVKRTLPDVVIEPKS
jgi:2'-5' RNA ligase